jgi:hypothetical protein
VRFICKSKIAFVGKGDSKSGSAHDLPLTICLFVRPWVLLVGLSSAVNLLPFLEMEFAFQVCGR